MLRVRRQIVEVLGSFEEAPEETVAKAIAAEVKEDESEQSDE